MWVVVAAVVSGVGVLTGMPWWQGLAAGAAALSGSAILLRRVVRRIGGVTGDVLGALIESSFVLMVVVVAA